jgi:beta-glucosidase
MTAFHLDAGYTPLFPFGHGLSYASFDYDHLNLSTNELELGETITISVELTNTSKITASEVVQLYVRDLVGNVTRPVKELKGFRRVVLEPEETVTVRFDLHTDELAFYGRRMQLMTEPGEFHVWVGGSSDAELMGEFQIIKSE